MMPTPATAPATVPPIAPPDKVVPSLSGVCVGGGELLAVVAAVVERVGGEVMEEVLVFSVDDPPVGRLLAAEPVVGATVDTPVHGNLSLLLRTINALE